VRPADLVQQGGPLRAALSGARIVDLVNLIGLLAPIALATLALPFTLGRATIARREALVLGALLAPLLTLMLVVHPQQGIFRDIDVFAPSAVAISAFTAWLVGETLRDRPRHAWLAAPVALTCVASSVCWLALHHDVPRGTAWVKSLVTDPPGRSPNERGLTWDYLGSQAAEADRWTEAAEAFEHAAETAPSPRILSLWGAAEMMTGRFDRALELYRRSLALDPNSRIALRGLAWTSFRVGDYAEARRAALELQRRNFDAPEVPEMLRALDSLGVGGTPDTMSSKP
jgi:hypothetical protein